MYRDTDRLIHQEAQEAPSNTTLFRIDNSLLTPLPQQALRLLHDQAAIAAQILRDQDDSHRFVIADESNRKVQVAFRPFEVDITPPSPLNDPYWYQATVTKEGELSTNTRLLAVQRSGETVRHPFLPRFSDLFSLSVNHFEQVGTPITAIVEKWMERVGSVPSVNYETFLAGLANGFSREEAAFQTPNGKLAKRHGFSHVSIVDFSNSSPMKIGLFQVHFMKA